MRCRYISAVDIFAGLLLRLYDADRIGNLGMYAVSGTEKLLHVLLLTRHDYKSQASTSLMEDATAPMNALLVWAAARHWLETFG